MYASGSRLAQPIETVLTFDMTPELRWTFQIASGVFWTLTYLLIIRRGFRDKALGMPLTALAANVSWEFIFSFIHPHGAPQIYVNYVWFVFDGVIVYQAVKFGARDFPKNLSTKAFYPFFALVLVLSFCAVLFVTREFKDWDGKYAAFGQNLMMSVLFVTMLLRRDSVVGQSLYIALFKLIGTLLPSILFYRLFPTLVLLKFLYVAIFIFDLIYVVLVYRKLRHDAISPWARF
jgi:hypothetical protein